MAYESDFEAIKKYVPEPLKPVGNVVLYEWIRMPDSTGFGDYTESGTVCCLGNHHFNIDAYYLGYSL